ncbi:hypothetical protein Cadr_000030826 [Camelus dromedarius]|uniref:Uncharacterized protein n=1 Tax=Camelus dromedarius TaxID=9838 RepID=A0A5N4BZA0_CAMDR|nr:hypothetical protein Cadr_000030826 [Camelus dromedarius]
MELGALRRGHDAPKQRFLCQRQGKGQAQPTVTAHSPAHTQSVRCQENPSAGCSFLTGSCRKRPRPHAAGPGPGVNRLEAGQQGPRPAGDESRHNPTVAPGPGLPQKATLCWPLRFSCLIGPCGLEQSSATGRKAEGVPAGKAKAFCTDILMRAQTGPWRDDRMRDDETASTRQSGALQQTPLSLKRCTNTCPGNAPVQLSLATGLVQGGERGHCKGNHERPISRRRDYAQSCTDRAWRERGEGQRPASGAGVAHTGSRLYKLPEWMFGERSTSLLTNRGPWPLRRPRGKGSLEGQHQPSRAGARVRRQAQGCSAHPNPNPSGSVAASQRVLAKVGPCPPWDLLLHQTGSEGKSPPLLAGAGPALKCQGLVRRRSSMASFLPTPEADPTLGTSTIRQVGAKWERGQRSPVLERGGGGGLAEPAAGTDSDLYRAVSRRSLKRSAAMRALDSSCRGMLLIGFSRLMSQLVFPGEGQPTLLRAQAYRHQTATPSRPTQQPLLHRPTGCLPGPTGNLVLNQGETMGEPGKALHTLRLGQHQQHPPQCQVDLSSQCLLPQVSSHTQARIGQAQRQWSSNEGNSKLQTPPQRRAWARPREASGLCPPFLPRPRGPHVALTFLTEHPCIPSISLSPNPPPHRPQAFSPSLLPPPCPLPDTPGPSPSLSPTIWHLRPPLGPASHPSPHHSATTCPTLHPRGLPGSGRGTSPADTLILDFQAPGPGRNTFLLFKVLSQAPSPLSHRGLPSHVHLAQKSPLNAPGAQSACHSLLWQGHPLGTCRPPNQDLRPALGQQGYISCQVSFLLLCRELGLLAGVVWEPGEVGLPGKHQREGHGPLSRTAGGLVTTTHPVQKPPPQPCWPSSKPVPRGSLASLDMALSCGQPRWTQGSRTGSQHLALSQTMAHFSCGREKLQETLAMRTSPQQQSGPCAQLCRRYMLPPTVMRAQRQQSSYSGTGLDLKPTTLSLVLGLTEAAEGRQGWAEAHRTWSGPGPGLHGTPAAQPETPAWLAPPSSVSHARWGSHRAGPRYSVGYRPVLSHAGLGSGQPPLCNHLNSGPPCSSPESRPSSDRVPVPTLVVTVTSLFPTSQVLVLPPARRNSPTGDLKAQECQSIPGLVGALDGHLDFCRTNDHSMQSRSLRCAELPGLARRKEPHVPLLLPLPGARLTPLRNRCEFSSADPKLALVRDVWILLEGGGRAKSSTTKAKAQGMHVLRGPRSERLARAHGQLSHSLANRVDTSSLGVGDPGPLVEGEAWEMERHAVPSPKHRRVKDTETTGHIDKDCILPTGPPPSEDRESLGFIPNPMTRREARAGLILIKIPRPF